jgi:hypothetical protein
MRFSRDADWNHNGNWSYFQTQAGIPTESSIVYIIMPDKLDWRRRWQLFKKHTQPCSNTQYGIIIQGCTSSIWITMAPTLAMNAVNQTNQWETCWTPSRHYTSYPCLTLQKLQAYPDTMVLYTTINFIAAHLYVLTRVLNIDQVSDTITYSYSKRTTQQTWI